MIRHLVIGGVLLVSLTVHAAGPAPADVDKAIAKAKAHIYSTQRNGTWELADQGEESPTGRHRGGLTALATYALLAAGESPQDPRLVKAIEFLKKADMPSVYALGCRAQIWPLLPQGKETIALAKADAERIVKQVKGQEPARGLFHYPETPQNTYDISISQYGVLGLWACQQAGAEVRGPVWDAMDKAWRGKQLKDGAWCYIIGDPNPEHSAATPSMTVAGIATLFLTHDVVRANQYLACAGNKTDDDIARGIDWLTKHYDQVYTGGARGPGAVYYTLYGVERVGVASGYKYFGTHDWFNEGAAWLLKQQAANGSFGGAGDLFGRNYAAMPNTAFALLFLSRGQSPVIVNKLRYEPAAKTAKPSWNQRPRDAANLAHWLGRSLEKPLNWQVTSLDAPVDELLDAPVLYVTGSQPLAFSPDQEAKLKAFVEDGGLILGNADCSSPTFAKSFVDLGQRMFKEYEFRTLPDEHPILTNQQYVWTKFKTKPGVQALSNGSRELMLLTANDPSRVWQTPYDGRLEPYALGGNILLYAVDKKGLRNRNVTHVVRADPKAATTKALKIARLQYAGNWDPEPGGWRRVAAILRNQDKIDAKAEAVELGGGALIKAPANVAAGPAKPDAKEIRTRAFKRIAPDKIAETAGDTAKIEALIVEQIKAVEKELADEAAKVAKAAPRNSAYDVAHLTGTAKFTFNAAQVAELKAFVAGGGLLIVDAAGGSTEFADAADAALRAALADDAAAIAALKAPLPKEHALFKPTPEKSPELYRAFARKRLGNVSSPRVRGVTVNGRLGVLFSAEDLSTGLVGHDVDGITGYAPAAATAIVRAAVVGAAR